ncbi:MAG: NifU family protein [Sphingobacteriales bacterium]|jgi:Fe-S cluster biogenesis protein NfuA|nr:NifU family protein [Sphingobacteriales bacterium]MBP9142181.1 NifU family protein [Chitinophagales bacterium]MDA0197740.1 NifU family protein [Bacteroidota bacterium]MBK6891013.1 NifU family protein [Sphingobacteriales bacterium]MBK7527157.1 NifU family protein [Sphingobacteriales bacterium]
METTPKQSLLQRIETSLDSVRPHLIADGGNIEVVQLSDDNVLTLRLTGSCGDCPMSAMTFKLGIEQAIKMAVPEIVSIEAL